MAVVWQPASGAGGVPAVLVELPRPPVSAVLALHDRSVFIANMEQPPSGFVLARRWVRNDPETDVESVPQQQSSVSLPRPGVAAVASAEEAPQFPDDSDDYNPEESVKRLKRHWVSVRRHDTEQRLQRLQQSSGERLRVLSGVAVPQVQQLPAVPPQLVHAGALAEQQQQQQQQVKQEQEEVPTQM